MPMLWDFVNLATIVAPIEFILLLVLVDVAVGEMVIV